MVESTSETASVVTGMPSRNLPMRFFGRMRKRLEARQAEEPAGAFDRVNEPENIGENLGVVGLGLEADELDVDEIEVLVRFGQEFLEQVFHDGPAASMNGPGNARPSRRGEFRPGKVNFH